MPSLPSRMAGISSLFRGMTPRCCNITSVSSSSVLSVTAVPTMPTRKPIMSSMALLARISTSLHRLLQPVMSMAVLPWDFMVTGLESESLGGLCLSVPMPLGQDSLDGCRDNSPASTFVVSAMCQWSWSILTDAYAQES